MYRNKNVPHYYLWNFKIPQVKQNIQSLNLCFGTWQCHPGPQPKKNKNKNKIGLHHAQAYRKVWWYCIENQTSGSAVLTTTPQDPLCRVPSRAKLKSWARYCPLPHIHAKYKKKDSRVCEISRVSGNVFPSLCIVPLLSHRLRKGHEVKALTSF